MRKELTRSSSSATHVQQTTDGQPRKNRNAMPGTVYSHGLAAVMDLHERDVST